jgi:hypothetical protein
MGPSASPHTGHGDPGRPRRRYRLGARRYTAVDDDEIRAAMMAAI